MEPAPRAGAHNELGRWLLDEARAVGFDDAGLVRADRCTPRADELRRAADAGHLRALPWLADSVDDRAQLRRRYPYARSMLVVVQNYFSGHHDEHLSTRELDGAAKVSRYAWGGDYHNSMRKRLRKLRGRLLARAGEGAQAAVFNDLDPVLERAWAEAAGLGFIGKSNLFIHRRFGTWTFLGGLVTDVELEQVPDPLPPHHLCGTCTRCLDACPTGALVQPGVLDVARCLTTWNIERPHDDAGAFLDDATLVDGSGWAAGCDLCQEVCPWNRFEQRTDDPRYQPREGHVALRPESVPADLQGTPLARPGREGIERSTRRAVRTVDDGD